MTSEPRHDDGDGEAGAPLEFRLLDRIWAGDYRIFGLRQEWRRHPRADRIHRYTVVACPDWVNVIAIDPQGQFVLVRQWRAGRDEVTLEIPGGMIDPGEDAIDAARRELREETGYTGGEAYLLGQVTPNPAFLTNQAMTVVVQGCQRTQEPQPDPGEALEVYTLTADQVLSEIRGGGIDHALVVAAFAHYAFRGGFAAVAGDFSAAASEVTPSIEAEV